MLPNASSCAGHTVRPTNQNVGVWSRERFIAGPCKVSGWLVLNPELPRGFQQSIFKGQVRGWGGHRVCDQLVHSFLIG